MHESLKKLVEGNNRFANNKSIHPNRSQELRNSLLNEQKPFAAVISCADSRVPVEIIFDVGLGDLFVIRTAGHVLSKETLGSIEYAVKELDIKCIVILGHDNCGAVKSALSIYNKHEDNNLSENLKALLDHIFPVFEKIDTTSKNAIGKAVKENILYQVQDLINKDSYLAQKVKAKEILVVGAKYSLDTGLIEIYNKA